MDLPAGIDYGIARLSNAGRASRRQAVDRALRASVHNLKHVDLTFRTTSWWLCAA
jgi:hypothetical protein